jgi:hypothetical protein
LEGSGYGHERGMVVRALLEESLLSEKEAFVQQLLLENTQLKLRVARL